MSTFGNQKLRGFPGCRPKRYQRYQSGARSRPTFKRSILAKRNQRNQSAVCVTIQAPTRTVIRDGEELFEQTNCWRVKRAKSDKRTIEQAKLDERTIEP